MNYGCFFEFDFESSNLQKGITIFNYRWLENEDTKNDRKTPHHPIYLSFSPEAIRFNLHYLEDKNAINKQEGKTDTNAERQIDAKPDWRHYHNTIIELPLSSNVEESDRLTDVLNDAYQAIFPISGNTYLRDDIDYSFEAQDCRKEGFSFACFEPDKKEWYKSGNPTHFLRKLILDFLFDLEFSDVFQNSPFFNQVQVRLKNNFLFNALRNKTRYYYYRTALSKQELIVPIEKESGSDEEKKKSVDRRICSFVEKYAKAEQDWVTSILDKRAMLQFHKSPWFEESNVELEQVFWSRRRGKWRVTQNETEGSGNSSPVPEVGKNYRIQWKRKRYLTKIGASKDSFRLTVDDAIKLAKEGVSSKTRAEFKAATDMHVNTVKDSVKWQVHQYHFGGVIKIWCGNMRAMWLSVLLSLPLLMLIVLCLWSMIDEHIIDDLIKVPNNNSWFSFASILFWIGLSYSLVMIMSLHIRVSWGRGTWNLLMPRLLAAIIAAWFTMSMTDDLFKNFVGVDINWSAIIILFFSTLLFVGYESRQLNPFDKPKYNILSSLALILIAYFYSFVIGLMVFDFFGMQMLTDTPTSVQCLCASLIPKPQSNKWEFVFQFSFFATFIGIFLNLMFKGKSITDSNN